VEKWHSGRSKPCACPALEEKSGYGCVQTEAPIWLPLESNPDVLTKMAHELGASAEWAFTDIWGLDDEVLAAQTSMFSAPVIALLFLFPSRDDAENRKLPHDGSATPVYFLRQVPALGNACGTIGVIHALSNLAKSGFPILGAGALQNFLEKTKDKTPEERGRLLAYEEEIRKIHDGFAQQGQTATPGKDDHVNFHFICFLNIDNHLWSIDGMRAQPNDKGATNQETFLRDCAKVIKSGWLEKNREETRFSVIALTQLGGD